MALRESDSSRDESRFRMGIGFVGFFRCSRGELKKSHCGALRFQGR